MSRVVVPNLATSMKTRVCASAAALAIGLVVVLVTGSLGLAGVVMGAAAIAINLVRYRQERSAPPQPLHTPEAD
jgi:hypothetical protein